MDLGAGLPARQPERMVRSNDFGQPVGPLLPDFYPCERPRHVRLSGTWCDLEPLAPEHADDLFEACSEDDGRMWTYLSFGPFGTADALYDALETLGREHDWIGFAIRVDARVVGVAHYMRIEPAAASVEVGAVVFSPRLQRTTAATEAMFRMADRAFREGYRRYEWKCDALNAASWRAAERLGFSHEGVHRNARVYKGRSRDTAWFSILDTEWPRLRAGFERWLRPDNFDEGGKQRRSLASCFAPA